VTPGASRTGRIVAVGLIAVGVLIAAFDLWAIATGGTDASISRFMLRGFEASPILVAALVGPLGILAGHLLWAQPCQREHQ
jgi:hypothetical protein